MAQVQVELSVTCEVCGKELYHGVATDAGKAREDFAKGMTASELHDCQGTPKSVR